MSETTAEGSFTVALVTGLDPVQVTFQEFSLGPEFIPDDVFDQAYAPRILEYPFSPDDAVQAVLDAGYERTTGWQWTGTHWGAVVQSKGER